MSNINISDIKFSQQKGHIAAENGPRFFMLPSFKTELCNPGFWRGALGECVGTMMLTFVLCATWISWEPIETDIVKISLSAGFIYTALIYSFGPISGGHLNPILSFSFLITRKITVFRGFIYVIAQCTGSTCGALLLFACVPHDIRKNLGVNMMNAALLPKHGFGFESALTFILVFMALSTLDAKSEIPGCKSISLGLTYSALHFAGLTFSGASFNPARSLGPALVIFYWRNHWIYWVGPFFGSAMASLFYYVIFDPYNPINAYRIMNGN
ncbi:unnamed protein product [Gordionus sp. m RMFG-2023]|uniref:aquaporin AQPAe.a-like n=1 Tax=Gordionus sp. m RMFG-2023 TaxID=3053472 RepID=UPI0030E12FC8